jgi:ABC-type transport system involved in multi-copper enzyme maturation permease subunit
MLNGAVWRQAWGDQRLLWLSLAALWGAFPWIYIWLQAQVPMGDFQLLLRLIPADWQKLSGVPIAEVATHAGRVALAFVDPVVVLGATVWGVTRGSDAVAGPLERGTLEMVLAAPVRRSAVYASQAAATITGALALAGVLLTGIWTAVAFGPWSAELDPARFLPAVANVFGLMVCMAGLAALCSAAGNHRSLAIGVLAGFYVISLLAKLVGRFSERLEWVGWLSVFNAYEPQRLVSGEPAAWWLLARYDAALLGVGLFAYVVGGIIFARRDLPAPL